MNIEDCIKFTRDYPICYLATIDDNQPKVGLSDYGSLMLQVSISRQVLLRNSQAISGKTPGLRSVFTNMKA